MNNANMLCDQYLLVLINRNWLIFIHQRLAGVRTLPGFPKSVKLIPWSLPGGEGSHRELPDADR